MQPRMISMNHPPTPPLLETLSFKQEPSPLTNAKLPQTLLAMPTPYRRQDVLAALEPTRAGQAVMNGYNALYTPTSPTLGWKPFVGRRRSTGPVIANSRQPGFSPTQTLYQPQPVSAVTSDTIVSGAEDPQWTGRAKDGRLPTPISPSSVDLKAKSGAKDEHPPSPKTKVSATKKRPTAKRLLTGNEAPRMRIPLSEIAKSFPHIVVKDTCSWVQRSTLTRRQELREDFVKRPPNSFILYRSAYADVCREYERSNNHQDISSLAGASWSIESPEVKEAFCNWSKLERANHQLAFPNYKFQPQQDAKAKKRRRSDDDACPPYQDDTVLGSRPVTATSAASSSYMPQYSDSKRKLNHYSSQSSPADSIASFESWTTDQFPALRMPTGFTSSGYSFSQPQAQYPDTVMSTNSVSSSTAGAVADHLGRYLPIPATDSFARSSVATPSKPTPMLVAPFPPIKFPQAPQGAIRQSSFMSVPDPAGTEHMAMPVNAAVSPEYYMASDTSLNPSVLSYQHTPDFLGSNVSNNYQAFM